MEKNKEEKPQEKTTTEEKPKIVNLCEDMNYHEHDEKSYEKMVNNTKK